MRLPESDEAYLFSELMKGSRRTDQRLGVTDPGLIQTKLSVHVINAYCALRVEFKQPGHLCRF